MYYSRTNIAWPVIVGAAFFVACDKGAGTTAEQGADAGVTVGVPKDEAKDEARASEKEKEKDQDVKAAERGIFARLPQDCSRMKLYVNLERFSKYEKTGGQIAAVAGKALARTDADERFVAPVIKALHAEGVDLSEDLDEVAACAEGKEDWLALLAVDLGDVKLGPRELLAKAVEAAGQKDASFQEKSGISYVVPKATGGALGFVADGVLGFASRPELLAKAASSELKGSSLPDDDEHLATVYFPAGDERGDFTLTGDDKSLTASLYLPLNEQQRKELGREVGRYLGLLRGMAEARLDEKAVADLQVPSIDRLMRDFDRLDMSVTKEDLRAKVTVSTEQLQQAVAALAEMKPASFERFVKGTQG